MNSIRVRASLYFLEATDSYMGNTWYSKTNILTNQKHFIEKILRSKPDDEALGIYVNNIELLDLLIITNNGLLSVYKDKGRYTPFNAIQRISAPQEGDQEIDIELTNNEFETISVQGTTGGIPDVFAFHSFLESLFMYSHGLLYEELKSVETEEDLVGFLSKHFGKRVAEESKLRFNDFETEFRLQNVDPDIRKAKGFWRLVGLWRIDDALLNEKNNDLFV